MPQSKCRVKRKSWPTSAQQREKIAPHELRRIILIGLLACSLMMCCACSPAVKIVKFMPPDYLLDDCEPVVSRQAKTNADLVNLVICMPRWTTAMRTSRPSAPIGVAWIWIMARNSNETNSATPGRGMIEKTFFDVAKESLPYVGVALLGGLVHMLRTGARSVWYIFASMACSAFAGFLAALLLSEISGIGPGTMGAIVGSVGYCGGQLLSAGQDAMVNYIRNRGRMGCK